MRNGLYVWILGLITLGALVGCGRSEPQVSTHSSRPAVLSCPDFPKYDFGVQTVGTDTPVSLNITNTGQLAATEMNGAFTVSAFAFTGGAFPGAGGTCSDTLAPGATCTVNVTFTPSYSSVFQESLRITYHNGIQYTQTSDPTLSGQGG